MMTTLSAIINPYKVRFEKDLFECLDSFGPKTELRNAIEYALTNEGKRFRPAIVFMVADAIGKNLNVSDAALAIEFFHTASMIADDLPCMDDDDERRSCPSLHVAFGEATALLASYALISAGYARIYENGLKLKSEEDPEADGRCLAAIENACYNTGILGACGGQYVDLFSQDRSEKALLEAIDKKTGTLFEISFVFGWLFGGGDLSLLEKVKKAARHFGRVFQICDDLIDREQDLTKGSMSVPAFMGVEMSLEIFFRELGALKEELQELRLVTPELLALVGFVESAVLSHCPGIHS